MRLEASFAPMQASPVFLQFAFMQYNTRYFSPFGSMQTEKEKQERSASKATQPHSISDCCIDGF